jgi:hypothetical protein
MLLAVALVTMVLPLDALAARRVVVRHRGPRTTLVVRRGFPIRRPLPRTVIVRRVRRPIVAERVVFLAPMVWVGTGVALPPRERLEWQDAETVYRDEDWVECNFDVGDRGAALYVELDGRAQFNFAEVTFGNGEVQVVDFQNYTRGGGVYRLLDFADGRRVESVRMVARAKSDEARLKLYMLK